MVCGAGGAPLHPQDDARTQRGQAGPPGSRPLTRRFRGALQAAVEPTSSRTTPSPAAAGE